MLTPAAKLCKWKTTVHWSHLQNVSLSLTEPQDSGVLGRSLPSLPALTLTLFLCVFSLNKRQQKRTCRPPLDLFYPFPVTFSPELSPPGGVLVLSPTADSNNFERKSCWKSFLLSARRFPTASVSRCSTHISIHLLVRVLLLLLTLGRLFKPLSAEQLAWKLTSVAHLRSVFKSVLRLRSLFCLFAFLLTAQRALFSILSLPCFQHLQFFSPLPVCSDDWERQRRSEAGERNPTDRISHELNTLFLLKKYCLISSTVCKVTQSNLKAILKEKEKLCFISLSAYVYLNSFIYTLLAKYLVSKLKNLI